MEPRPQLSQATQDTFDYFAGSVGFLFEGVTCIPLPQRDGRTALGVGLPAQRIFSASDVERHLLQVQSEIFLYRGIYMPYLILNENEKHDEDKENA